VGCNEDALEAHAASVIMAHEERSNGFASKVLYVSTAEGSNVHRHPREKLKSYM